MTFCPRCGHGCQPQDRFCRSCGLLLERDDGGTAATPTAPFQGSAWRLVPPVLVGLLVAYAAGWGAHLLPQSAQSAHGVGAREAAPTGSEVANASSSGSSTGSGSESRTGLGRARTAFATSCGKLLDVVPVEAASSGSALRVTLEFRPVCPTGESVASGRLRLDLVDPSGAPLAVGTFDFRTRPLFVPGFADPTTTVLASFGPGTAWVAPDTLASQITAGVVRVACRAEDGSTGTPVRAGSRPAAPSKTAVTAAPASSSRDVQVTALAALRRQAAEDDASVSELEGSWIPQLSSKTDGTFDPLDDKRYTLADIYGQYLSLRLRYPNVRLLLSTDWRSYGRPGYWVVIAGVPFVHPEDTNTWCSDRGIPTTQCFAKQLVRDGVPEGTVQGRR